MDSVKNFNKFDISLSEFNVLLEALDARYLYHGLKKLMFLFYCNFYFYFLTSKKFWKLNFFNSSSYIFLPKKKKSFLTIRGPHVHSRSKETFELFFFKGFFNINFLSELSRSKILTLLNLALVYFLKTNKTYLKFCDLKLKKNIIINTNKKDKFNSIKKKVFSKIEFNILKKNWCQF